MIDLYWRKFLNGEIVDFLRALIQEALTSFFDFAIKEGIYKGEPRDNDFFRAAEDTNDLSRITRIYSQKFIFSFKGKEFDATLITCSRELKKVIGYKSYENRLDVGERLVNTIEIYNKFFSSARELGFKRNVDAHHKKEIIDSGHALSVAANVLDIIELNPNPIRNEDKLISVKKNLGLLLKALIEKEDPDLSIYQDRDEVKVSEKENKEVDNSIGDIKQSLKVIESKLISIENLDEKFEAIYKKTILQAVIDSKSQEIIDAKKTLTKKQILKDKEHIEETNEEVFHKESGMLANRETLVENKNYITPQQALGDMTEMQKRFKNEFECENWENIAQGPFRQQIINNKIQSREDFFKNRFIKMRYRKNKAAMDPLIESDLGDEFFLILPRILFQ